ncbi:MAG: glycerol kinase GlpK [Candidatus Baltobacteraceae bacterium]
MILALDQGTSSSRAIVFDRYGNALGSAQRAIAQSFPRDGWVEHDPRELWISQREAARDALAAAGVSAHDIAAIGIANQRETTLLWDRRTGEPLCNAIVWQDRRTAGECERLRLHGVDQTVRRITGLVLDPYFSATKLAWMLDVIDGARDRAERGELAFGTVDAWLIWNLTAGARHVTDATNAARTMLFDIRSLRWSEELLELFAIPRAILPEVLPCTAAFGRTAADRFGISLPICGVAGDQHAALAGQAGFHPGIAKNTYGTGAFAMLHTGAAPASSSHGLLTTLAYAFDMHSAAYALEGSVFNTGTAVQWLRDGLGMIEQSAEIEPLARACEEGSGVFFIPAFTGLGAPYWDPAARGTITGITRATTRAHLARAALEAIAFQCAQTFEAMQRDARMPLHELRVDGGGAQNALLLQMQADYTGTTVVRPRITETTALGAAFFAGLQCGFWDDMAALARVWKEDARFTPAIDGSVRAAKMRGWERAVERSRHWAE